MATITPEGEALRKAVKWVSDQLQAEPGLSRQEAIDEAIMRFDLSPKDADFLVRVSSSKTE